ncbi:MAG: hypothetical protein J2P26_13615, partial [Nocardiopsaceae bacterium]|nr:hypothetical protein [Nocardiopsaceae bacterium]
PNKNQPIIIPNKPEATAPEAADSGRCRSVTFAAPGGPTVLLARWADAAEAAGSRARSQNPRSYRTLPPARANPGGHPPEPPGAPDLMEDAAHSLRMALEREKALADRQEAMALRRSRDMQHAFLRRLSHELRTPLTAITGYASSLLQQDVIWDAGTQQRFLTRIAAESSRLGRLVNDLLDFSAIESGIFRLDCDWCDLPLVIDAAVAVLPPDQAPMVAVTAPPALPAVWGDHDRLEQVFVNLLGNALGHNPPGTRVRVTASAPEPGAVTVLVADDGYGMPPGLLTEPPAVPPTGPATGPTTAPTAGERPHRRGAGAGLGLSIARGIVAAHDGRLELDPAPRGTRLRITLPTEKPPKRAEPT